MQLRKVHVGTVSYANEAMAEVANYVKQGFSGSALDDSSTGQSGLTAPSTRSRREIGSRVRDLVLALALCHKCDAHIKLRRWWKRHDVSSLVTG
ncbi:hypothetical protein MRB53_038710 [Persea americana]|nr:hypothetical protein MRB53_038710 [Persea americana]